jgi:hypothetical protein
VSHVDVCARDWQHDNNSGCEEQNADDDCYDCDLLWVHRLVFGADNNIYSATDEFGWFDTTSLTHSLEPGNLLNR